MSTSLVLNLLYISLGAGRIGYRVLQRLVPFECKELLYYDYAALPEDAAKSVNARRVEKFEVRFLRFSIRIS